MLLGSFIKEPYVKKNYYSESVIVQFYVVGVIIIDLIVCLFYGLDFSLYDNIIMKSISDFGVWEMMRFKQVSIGLMVFFAMMNIFCTLV